MRTCPRCNEWVSEHHLCPVAGAASRSEQSACKADITDEAFAAAHGVYVGAEAAQSPQEGAALEALRVQKDAAYQERNRCVAGLARTALRLGWRVGLGRHEDRPGEAWDADWRTIVFLDLPTGQVSWHLHDSDVALFDGLPEYSGAWDGHDTPEKYRRLAELGRSTSDRPPASESPGPLAALREARNAMSYVLDFQLHTAARERIRASLAVIDSALRVRPRDVNGKS